MRTNEIANELMETKLILNGIIKGMAKKRKQIIYGARSIEAQNKLFARDTKDWDVFDKNPKKVAKMVENILDKRAKTDYYYVQEAIHKGTWKVKGRGNDFRKGTKDDESIADYSKLEKNTPFVTIGGIRYRTLKEEIKAKKKAIADPEFEFRHKKDKDDLQRIKGYLKVKSIVGKTI